MNRNLTLLITGAGVGICLAAVLASRSRVIRESVADLAPAFPSRNESAKMMSLRRPARGTRWVLGGGGGMLAAWGAAHRGPLGALAGLAGAAMLSKATVRRSPDSE